MRKLVAVIALVLALGVLAPAYAVADSGTRTYEFELEVPNVSMAPNGDRVAVTGHGEFSVNPKSVHGHGAFTHTFASGGSVSGTWTADELLDFQSYGCGIVLGGTIFCIIGPNPPNSHDDPSEEGITLVVPGIANFNQILSGMNVFILEP